MARGQQTRSNTREPAQTGTSSTVTANQDRNNNPHENDEDELSGSAQQRDNGPPTHENADNTAETRMQPPNTTNNQQPLTGDSLEVQLLRSQLREAQLERDLERAKLESRTGHRRFHSDDGFQEGARKKGVKLPMPEEQNLTNYNSLCTWMADCEDYFRQRGSEYEEDDAKITLANLKIVQAKRSLWRTHLKGLIQQEVVPTWEMYCEYLKGLVSNPTIRQADTEGKLEAAKQRDWQTVSEFNEYLTTLWDELDSTPSEVERMRNLRTKVRKEIRTEALGRKEPDTLNYPSLLKHYIGIEHLLRNQNKLEVKGKPNAKDKEKDKQKDSSTPRTDNTRGRGRGTYTRGQRGNRGRGSNTSRGGSSQTTVEVEAKISDENITCYKCQQKGHKSNNPICPKYSETNENRNTSSQRGKAKA